MTYGHVGAAGGGSKPSGVTAIAAGLFVGLTGLWHVVGLVAGIVTISGDTTARGMIVGIGLNAVLAGVSLTGTVALLARATVGRVLVVVAGVLALAMYGFLSLLAVPDGLRGESGAAALAIVSVPALAAVVLVALPSTSRWLRWGKPTIPPPSYQPGGIPS